MSEEGPLPKLPLLPSAVGQGVLGNLDISDVLRATTREFLEKRIYDRKNLYSVQALEEYEQNVNEIHEAEDVLMLTQAQNVVVRESYWQMGDRSRDFENVNIPEYYINKYHLLTNVCAKPKDFFTTRPTVTRLYQQDTKDKMKQVNTIPKKAGTNRCPHLTKLDEISLPEKIYKHELMDECSDMEGIKKLTGERPGKNKDKYFLNMNTKDVHVEPKLISFSNYTRGETYKENVKLMNFTPYSFHLKLIRPKNSSIFDLNDVFVGKRSANEVDMFLAPGMYITLNITFNCRDYDDYYDSFSFEGEKLFHITIPIEAIRSTPCLKSRCYLEINNPGVLTRKLMIQSVIFDCGETLTGGTSTFYTQLYNSGSLATFYVTSDMYWIRKNYLYWNEYGEVVTPPFKLSPAIFDVKTDGNIILKIKFNPKLDGVYIESYKIICNNLTMRPLIVIGDSVPFDPKKIYLLNTLSSRLPADIVEDPTCKQFVHMGLTCPGRTVSQTITVRNASRINYRYKWKCGNLCFGQMQYSASHFYYNFPTECIAIKCECHMLLARRDSLFTIEVSFTDPSIQPGLYKCKLRLVIHCIPTESLTDETMKEFVTEQNEKGTSSVELFDIEVWIHVEIPFVDFDKYYIFFCNVTFKRKRAALIARNKHRYEINLEWRQPKYSTNVLVYVEPRELTIPPAGHRGIFIFIDPLQEGPFLETIEFTVNRLVSYNVLVEGTIETPELSVDYQFNDFGILLCKDDLTVAIPLKHADSERKPIYVREITFLTPDEGKEYFTIGNDQIIDCFVDKTNRNITTICYQCFTDTEVIYTSLLEFKRNNKSAYLAIIFEVQNPHLIISPKHYEVHEALYKNVLHETNIHIMNAHTVHGIFIWINDPIGEDADKLEVVKEPEKGLVGAQMTFTVNISIMPLKEGIVQDFTIPVYMPDTKRYMYFTLSGVVKDLSVRIYWEGTKTKCYMTWPPGTTTGDDEEEEGYCCACFPGSTSVMGVKGELVGTKEAIDDNTEKKIISFVDSTISTCPYTDWPLVGGKYYFEGQNTNDMDLEYDNQQCYCEYQGAISKDYEYSATLIEWYKGKAITFELEDRKPMKKVITVRNLTPMRIMARMYIKNFKGKWMNLNHIKCGKQFTKASLQEWIWENNLRKGQNLVLSLESKKMEILPNDYINIGITAYSNFWGVYSDELVIKLPNLPIFILPIIVIVKQTPVHFTLAPNERSTILRFASVTPQQPCTQYVYVKNTSPEMLKIIWKTYGPPGNPIVKIDYDIPTQWKPFNVEVDLFNENPDNFCKIRLNDYFGDIQCPYFKVKPTLMYLEPNEKRRLTVTLKPRDWVFKDNQFKSTLYGKLRGIIYTFNPIKPPLAPLIPCFRSDGYDYEPVELTLTAQIQVSQIRAVNSIASDFQFDVHIVDIMDRPEFGYREVRSVVLKNIGDSAAHVTLKIDRPFHLLKIDHINKERIHQSPTFKAELGQEESIEVSYELRLLSEDIPGEMFTFRWRPQSTIYSITDELQDYKEYKLNVTQEGCADEVLILSLKLIPPYIDVSVFRVTFGPVYLRDTKTQQITLKSMNKDEVVTCTLQPEGGAFDVTPRSVLLRTREVTDISVSFCPQEPGEYLCSLTIQSCFPTYYKNVTMTGIGIWNYKYRTVK